MYYRKINGEYIHLGRADKSISVRLPKSVYDIVMQCEGNCFSQKLINLIMSYKFMSDSVASGKM